MNFIFLLIALAATLPGIWLRFSGVHLDPILSAAIYGLAILGAAFLISWTAEASQMDISGALAIAFLALITVLPEYAVDMTLAWAAAGDPPACQVPVPPQGLDCYGPLAIANMTGGNRLLIGTGWSLVVILYWIRSGKPGIQLLAARRVELLFLAIATAYCLIIPLRGEIGLFDAAFLVGLFIVYLIVSARGDSEEPHLIGPARIIGEQPRNRRRPLLVILFLFCAAAIFAVAEPFAESLIEVGEANGVDKFLLIQWIAPLASESPEMVVAIIFALQLKANTAMGALISSKVNQWTLLIGTLPIVYSLARALGGQSIGGVYLDIRQIDEVFLTGAQSLFALAVILDLRIRVWEAVLLFSLFAAQFLTPFWAPLLPDVIHNLFRDGEIYRDQRIFAYIYIALAVLLIAIRPSKLNNLVLGAQLAWNRLRGRSVPSVEADGDEAAEHVSPGQRAIPSEADRA